MNHIALICDDAYVLPTAVTIQSIKECLETTKAFELCVHVCTPGLTDVNEAKLKSIADRKMCVLVHVVDFNKMSEKINKISRKTHVSTAALIKFELPNIFKDIDRILYLDSDIVVRNNFLNIFSVDLSDCYLAAVFEFWKYLNDMMYSPSNVKKNIFFFNSGVMFFNLKKMRSDLISEKLWDFKLNHTKTKLMDQECFNEICRKKVKSLSIEWNLNPIFLENKYINLINKVYHTRYKHVNDLYENANVIHYVGKSDKPWIYKKARMNNLWMSIYEKIYPAVPLKLSDFECPRINLMNRIFNSIVEHGLIGFLNYMKYKFISWIRQI